MPLRKHRLSQLFAAWQSCQGCTHSTQFSRTLRPEMPRTYQVPTSPNLDHFPPCPARPPRPAGWHGWPALALWVVASYLAIQLPELPWLAQLASLVSPSCPPVAADAFHGRKAFKFCGAGQGQRGAGPELPPSTRAAYPHGAGTQLPPSTRDSAGRRRGGWQRQGRAGVLPQLPQLHRSFFPPPSVPEGDSEAWPGVLEDQYCAPVSETLRPCGCSSLVQPFSESTSWPAPC